MPIPAIAVAGLIAAGALGAGAAIYSQNKQRELYRYQKRGYERQLEDWHRNVPNRQLAYPELSIPGHIRALDTGISQSYASSIGSISRLSGSFLGTTHYGYGSGRSLYGRHSGRSSRYL